VTRTAKAWQGCRAAWQGGVCCCRTTTYRYPTHERRRLEGRHTRGFGRATFEALSFGREHQSTAHGAGPIALTHCYRSRPAAACCRPCSRAARARGSRRSSAIPRRIVVVVSVLLLRYGGCSLWSPTRQHTPTGCGLTNVTSPESGDSSRSTRAAGGIACIHREKGAADVSATLIHRRAPRRPTSADNGQRVWDPVAMQLERG